MVYLELDPEFSITMKTEVVNLSYVKTVDHPGRGYSFNYNMPTCYEVYKDTSTNKTFIYSCFDYHYNSDYENHVYNKKNVAGKWNLTYKSSRNFFGIERNQITTLNQYISG